MLKLPVLCLSAFFLLFSCRGGTGANRADAVSAASRQEWTAVQQLLYQYMPEAAAVDGIVKVAVIRNFSVSEHTRQFLDGCLSEGRALGFTVDTFITGGDNGRCRALIEKIAAADYDGLILSHGEAAFTADALKPALEKGLKIVTFDALPYKDGDPSNGVLAGVTCTLQDDRELARLSLEALVQAAGASLPLRVIRVWFGPGVPPLDTRQAVYDQFVADGKIREVALLSPPDFAFAAEGTREALKAVLPRLGEGEVDAIWAPYDEFARGCIDALQESGRQDIALASVDISNDDIKSMMDNPAVWVGTAALDPALVGVVDMRILAAKFAGELTPDEHIFGATFVRTSQLNRMVNMSNITQVVDGWQSSNGIFDQYPWMSALKKAVGKRRDSALWMGAGQ